MKKVPKAVINSIEVNAGQINKPKNKNDLVLFLQSLLDEIEALKARVQVLEGT